MRNCNEHKMKFDGEVEMYYVIFFLAINTHGINSNKYNCLFCVQKEEEEERKHN